MAQTAYGCLEQSHWEVAKAAMALAEQVERTLGAYVVPSSPRHAELTDALIRFREAAARPI